jgi:hypothetical protein
LPTATRKRGDQTQEQFLREALEHYEQLVQEEFQEPSLMREQGLALMRMGQMYR